MRLIVSMGLPPRELHPNSRAGWRAKATAKKNYRAKVGEPLAWAASLEAGKPKWPAAVVRLRYIFDKPARGAFQAHDGDNLIAWAKLPIDCLEAVELIANDRGLVYLPAEQRQADPVDPIRDNPRLEIDVWPVESTDTIVSLWLEALSYDD